MTYTQPTPPASLRHHIRKGLGSMPARLVRKVSSVPSVASTPHPEGFEVDACASRSERVKCPSSQECVDAALPACVKLADIRTEQSSKPPMGPGTLKRTMRGRFCLPCFLSSIDSPYRSRSHPVALARSHPQHGIAWHGMRAACCSVQYFVGPPRTFRRHAPRSIAHAAASPRRREGPRPLGKQ